MNILDYISGTVKILKKMSEHLLKNFYGNTNDNVSDRIVRIIPRCSEESNDGYADDNVLLDGERNISLTFREAQKAGFQFRYSKRNDHIIIKSIHVRTNKITIPAYIDDHPVTHISDNCRTIIEPNINNAVLIFPNTLTHIGENAFNVKLNVPSKNFWQPIFSEIYFPEGSVFIGPFAFYGQINLKKLHFGKNTNIDNHAFCNCSELEKIQLNDCTLSTGSFQYCSKLLDISWRSAVFNEYQVFDGTPFQNKHDLLVISGSLIVCKTNERVYKVPDNIIVISKDVFANNKKLERVILPPTVIVIERGGFRNCENLRYINLKNVSFIEESAFENCKKLDKQICFKSNVCFLGFPFKNTALASKSVTSDGIVINHTLLGGRPSFSGNVWEISEGIRKISGNIGSFDFDTKLMNTHDLNIIFPESVEHIQDISLFTFAKRLTFKNPDIHITSQHNFPSHLLIPNGLTLTFITPTGSSDIPVVFPKSAGDNPAVKKTEELYRKVFSGYIPDMDVYDRKILYTGMNINTLVCIAYERIKGGYKLTDINRTRYEEYLRLHIRRAVGFAEKYGKSELLDFLKSYQKNNF